MATDDGSVPSGTKVLQPTDSNNGEWDKKTEYVCVFPFQFFFYIQRLNLSPSYSFSLRVSFLGKEIEIAIFSVNGEDLDSNKSQAHAHDVA
jgi:hypothetical protein